MISVTTMQDYRRSFNLYLLIRLNKKQPSESSSNTIFALLRLHNNYGYNS